MKEPGMGIWITGIPASGKTSVARELVRMLNERAIAVVVLESDILRNILTPQPTYSPEERDWFYKTLADIGALIIRHKVNVIFDATANKQTYRNYARQLIPHFLEVYVQCPLEVCAKRDPKGIYAAAAGGRSKTVPGAQAEYEAPKNPEIILDGQSPPGNNADVIFRKLELLHIIRLA